MSDCSFLSTIAPEMTQPTRISHAVQLHTWFDKPLHSTKSHFQPAANTKLPCRMFLGIIVEDKIHIDHA